MFTKIVETLLIGLFLVALAGTVGAQNLPKSGSINWHTGWKISGEDIGVAEGHMQGHGSAIGTSFNDNGRGPLHVGPAECVYTYYATGNTVENKGYCAFGDADGDRIFTQWNGTGTSGTNFIVGGTGKYEGITGSGPWMGAEAVGKNGGWVTFQRLDYKLP